MIGRRLYRMLLLAFPASMRMRNGADMEQMFADRCREARVDSTWLIGTIRVAGLWLLAIRDALVNGLGARMSAAATLGQDARYALRGLKRSPGFTCVALTSLALGIGASTAIFTLLNAVVLRPLPVRAPEQVVRLASTAIGWDSVTNPMWEALRDREEIFDGSFAIASVYFRIGDEITGERIPGAMVSGEFFPTLGLTPAAGRLLEPGDDWRGCPGIVVLGHGYWQRAYGGDDVVGETIELNDAAFVIVGVAPEGFTGMTVEEVTDVYAPLCAEDIRRGGRSNLDAFSTWWLNIVARLPGGTATEVAQARLDALAPEVFAAAVPDSWGPVRRQEFIDSRILITPGATGFSDVRDDYEASLYVLFAAVGVVTLVVCVNLANLQLARAARRRKEIAMRRALGASAGRLIKQFLTESLLIAGAGAAAGVLMAHWISRTLVALITPPSGTLAIDLSLDPRVLGFVATLALLSAVLFGIAPALAAMRIDPFAVMRTSTAGGGPQRSLLAGGALVAAQVTLSLMLLTGAALLIGTFWHLQTLDPGFDRDNVLLVDADLRRAELDDEPRRAAFVDLAERLNALPGVRAASFAELVPIGGGDVTEYLVPEGFTVLLEEDVEVHVHRVGPGYFASMGTSIMLGRDLAADDTLGGEMVAVISESTARMMFGDVAAAGRSFHRRMSETEVSEPYRVAGVVPDAKYLSLRDEGIPTVYFAQLQTPLSWTGSTMTFHVLPEPGAEPMPTIRAEVERTAAGATAEINTLAQRLSASLARERLLAIIAGVFGALALFLAVIGLYGVMSFNVARRFHEIGVRLALGSSGSGVFSHVLAQAARPVIAGLLLGAIGSVTAARAIEAQLYGLSPYDVRAFAVAALVLTVAALLSAAVPARRAAGTDPPVVLRRDTT